MSGVVGIYHLDGRPVDPALLTRMTDRIVHRGPDGVGHWVCGPVGLGHRKLHATPESFHETQPWLDETGQLALTFDGRVDNRHELRAALKTEGFQLRTDTDPEIVLRSYERWGEECPNRIIGDFAFAIWDGAKRQLFCARDPLGVKPFYYHTDGRTFVFASEMQPLFEETTVARRPNLPILGLYLSGSFDEREETLYEGIYRLPSSHALIQSRACTRKIRYWDLDPAREVRYRTDGEYADHFLSLFREAVGSQLRSYYPVGAWLSGGLDSSSIVCTAQMLYREGAVPSNGFETFSILFDALPCDERAYVDEVVRRWGVTAHFVTHERELSSVDIGQTHLYPDVLHQTTLLMGAPALRDMQHRGIRVVLDGMGGDELLAAGFAHLTDMVAQRDFRNLMGQLRHDGQIYEVRPSALFWKYCCKPFVPSAARKFLKPLATRLRRDGMGSLLKPEFVAAADIHERVRASSRVRTFPTRAQQAIYDGLFAGWNVMAMDLNELFNARFSVESRRPFFDRRVIEFLVAVPEDQRWRGDQPKLILRRAMDGVLPEAVQWRKGKAEFSSPIDQELRYRQVNGVEEIFRNSALAALGIVDAARLVQVLARYRSRAHGYPPASIELLLGLELWCASIVGSSQN